jgi:hypothetical protein
VLTRRTMLKLPAVGLLSYLVPASWAAPETRRRALIVGIDKYTAPGESFSDESESSGGAHASASSKIHRDRRFFDLDGAVNDAELMNHLLQDRFGFAAADILFLKNEQASRARILHEFQAHLIDAASPGDLSLFYYAGHGSQVRNLASDEADQLDETLVPSDSEAGSPDIRDKEMARLYRTALNKHVLLTVVLDSCHSGGMSRGGWNRAGKTRNLPPSPTPIHDPPDRDPATGKPLPDPTSLGMLFLAAAREDQPAGETSVTMRDTGGAPREVAHGAFTAALAQVLQSPAANQSVEQICSRVQAMLASQGTMQVPICAGSSRQARGLLGQPAGMATAITLAVESVTGPSTLRLRGGSALGLATGCVLARTNAPSLRIELTHVDLGLSEARLMGSAAGERVRPGELFRLETWVAPPQKALAVFFPKDGPGADAVLATAHALDQLHRQGKIELVSEPQSSSLPTHVFYWHNGAYRLERFPRDGSTIALGISPSTEDLVHALAGATSVRLWPILPLDRQTASAIRLGAGTENAAVRIADDPANSIYLLAGRLHDGVIEYSWTFKDALVTAPAQVRLPLRTDWTSTSAQLTSLAVRLARIYGWLNLDGPSGGDPAFPYQLALEKSGSGQPAGAGPFKFGERYKFVFTADPAALKQAENSGGVAKRYVYVFLIDSSGDAQCLFPIPDNGNVGNLLPRGEPPEAKILATRADYDVEISEPAGTDNYFLVASEQPLDPGVFQWEGVRGPETKRGADNPLEFLFNSVGEGTRGGHAIQSVPATWSIQSFSVRSGP